MRRTQPEISRREERIYVTLPVKIRTGWEGGTEVKANTVDYSESGLRVRASAPLRVRQDVEVVVSGNPALKKNYSVMWVREPAADQSVYEAGLEVGPERPE